MPSALPAGDPAPVDGALPFADLQTLPGTEFGVYVHIPFCTTRCGYCDFNTYTATELGEGVSQGSYADTLVGEIRLAAQVLGRGRGVGLQSAPASTVFFGGGTPTLLPAEHLGLIVRAVEEYIGLTPDVEITTEANPESVAPGYLAKLREQGFNRISLGMQSAVPHVLDVLDRKHRPGRPEEAVAEARAAGFEHVNLDLIYGAPKETDADWQASLDAAVGAGPDHVSAYALVVEEGTALARQVAAGIVEPVDDDVLADRYMMAEETLAAAGYDWYEVSNWSRGARARSRHNQLYWQDANWWGFGPGAHSHIGGTRWWNVKHPARYAAQLAAAQSPAAARESLTESQRAVERVMLGVRLRDGLAVRDLPAEARGRLPQLARWGLIEHDDLTVDRVVLTLRGRLMADAVVRELT